MTWIVKLREKYINLDFIASPDRNVELTWRIGRFMFSWWSFWDGLWLVCESCSRKLKSKEIPYWPLRFQCLCKEDSIFGIVFITLVNTSSHERIKKESFFKINIFPRLGEYLVCSKFYMYYVEGWWDCYCLLFSFKSINIIRACILTYSVAL